METALHATTKKCTKCFAPLVLGDNWSEGVARARQYTCRSCNAAKGRAFYADNKSHVIETAKSRRNADLGKIRSYWQGHRERNRDSINAYHRGYVSRQNETVEGRAKRMLSRARCTARYQGVGFDLSLDWIISRLEIGTCEVTGLPFDLSLLPRGERGSRTPAFSPSLDRINRGGNYTKDNVRVTVFIYNVARSDFDDDNLLTLAKALAA